MIIRKPYAFLIKNFKKIHVVLLLLILFVAYRLFDVSSFVGEFMDFGIYDSYNNSISRHITFLLQMALILIVIGCCALILLLRHKKKPWKAYLIPLVEYFALIFVLSMVKGFFNSYTDGVSSTDLRMSRDLLMIFLIAQLPAIGIFIMRTFGLDINKFSFNTDEEFLELSEADREEIEVRLDIDKNTIKRTFRRLFRNIGYVYKEHKLICNTIIGLILIVIIYNVYALVFITNKSYKQGEEYNANGYTITVKDAYYTNKDGSGNVISDKSYFVVVDLSITNNIEKRKVDMNNFHLKSGTSDYTTTTKMYESEFSDFGECVDSVLELRRGGTLNTIIVYKVSKNNNSNFALYYQEKNNNNTLRKIKLNLKDVSKIKKAIKYKIGDNIKINAYNLKDTITFDDFLISNTATYTTRSCSGGDCSSVEKSFNANEGENILKISFGSVGLESKNLIDFLNKYGKIIYKDSEGIMQEISIESALDRSYMGKYVYIKIPSDISSNSNFKIRITLRDNRYDYSFN